MFRGFCYIFSILALVTTYDFCHKATRGFALVNIYPTEYQDYESCTLKEPIDQIFSQSFHLFSNGGQSYVFLSDDQKIILKLFKFQHHRIPPWLEHIPLTGGLLDKKNRKKAYKRGRLLHSYKSYENAFSYLKEESKLIEVNLSNKPHRYHSKIKIFDAQNICHEIDPNITPFLLQKKVDLFESVIENYISDQTFDRAYTSITNLLDLIAKRVSLVFVDNDAFLFKNIGIDYNQAVLIDVGSLEKYDSISYKEKLRQIDLVCKPLFDRIKNIPELDERVRQYYQLTIDPTLY